MESSSGSGGTAKLAFCLLLFLLAGAACGSSDKGGSGPAANGAAASGGGDGAGDAGGGGGSGGPSSGPAGLGLSLTVREPDAADNPDGLSCPVGSVLYEIGMPTGSGTVLDGTGNLSVTCTVRSLGGYYLVLVSLDDRQGDASTYFSLHLSGQVRAGAASTLERSLFASTATAALSHIGAGPCVVGPPALLEPGALIAPFDCPLLVTSDSTSGCALSGIIALEACDT